ncbi:MAG: YeaC family protein [Pseudohongiellaceae bacterium]|jgi:hypothetical protein
MTGYSDEQPVIAKPDSYETLLARLTPEIHARLKTAVELGKWDNGERLTPAQLEHCLQAIIAFDHRHLPEEARVAFIDRSGLGKSHCDD